MKQLVFLCFGLLKNHTGKKIYDISIKNKKSIDKLLKNLIKKRVNSNGINKEKWTPLKKN